MEINQIKVNIRKERIPTAWFWANHRIPRQLERIEEGKTDIVYFLEIFAMRRIPNYKDLINYYTIQHMITKRF